MVGLLERALGAVAVMRRRALPAIELPSTWANIERAAADFGFSPKVGLAEGVGHFVTWYTSYRRQRERQHN